MRRRLDDPRQLVLSLAPRVEVAKGSPESQAGHVSPVRGVSYDAGQRRWRLRLRVGGRRRSLGYYATAEAAALALVRAARSARVTL